MEEVLYPAMEDFQFDIVLGSGPSARSVRLDLPRFTLVGATTRTGLITGPLRDRFGLVERFDHYPVADLEAIVIRSAGVLGVPLDPAGAHEIARRARGTPRIANRLLRRVRDFAEVRGDGVVSEQAAHDGLKLFGVDELGLDKVDRALLRVLCERFGGGPVGLTTLAVGPRRAARDPGGRLRAVPPPGRPARPHPPGPPRPAGGVDPPRAPRAGRGHHPAPGAPRPLRLTSARSLAAHRPMR